MEFCADGFRPALAGAAAEATTKKNEITNQASGWEVKADCEQVLFAGFNKLFENGWSMGYGGLGAAVFSWGCGCSALM